MRPIEALLWLLVAAFGLWLVLRVLLFAVLTAVFALRRKK